MIQFFNGIDIVDAMWVSPDNQILFLQLCNGKVVSQEYARGENKDTLNQKIWASLTHDL